MATDAPLPAAVAAVGTANGRVNLLGEHTDYNDGLVLPTVIPQLTRVLMRRNVGGFEFTSTTTGERTTFPDDQPPPTTFAALVFGCVAVLRSRGLRVPAVSVRVSSTVPLGAGLSSSAALTVATLRALRHLVGARLSDTELALCARDVERTQLGVQIGVLDPMAVSLCQPERMLLLDTRDLSYRQLPLPADSEVVVVHSGTRRELKGTAYNERRQECVQAARQLGVGSLREVTDHGRAATLPDPLARRVRHVLGENRRVRAAAGASAPAFGTLMRESHASLRDDYEVSTPAL
ncbi:MAG: galactokinase, partial [Gammaproteobacteria bacterium]|nr:galactokinase [Gammaproteobacteria bacterium]